MKAARARIDAFDKALADRLIVVTAIHHGAALLTEDERILTYARKGGCRAVRLK